MLPTQKHPIRDYFIFTAAERRAVCWIVIITLLFLLLPRLFPLVIKPKAVLSKKENPLSTPAISPHATKEKTIYHFSKNEAPTLFPFDPNTADLEEWLRLGVKLKTAETIVKYRSKGGSFKRAEDLKKIWGLQPEQVQMLLPYVVIRDTSHKNRKTLAMSTKKTDRKILLIDINAASPESWDSLKGIGPVLAARIIKFRDKLGGFISVEQVRETYGLPDSVYLKIRDHLCYRQPHMRFNINVLNEEALSKHPYIRYKIAKAIVRYREQHGSFQSLNDLEKIEGIEAEIWEKIIPYLSLK